MSAGSTKFASDTAIKAGADAFTKSYDQMLAATREQVEKLFPAAVKNFDEVTAFQKDYFQALVTASATMAKGFETIAQQMLVLNQKSAEAGVAGAKALAGCKTVQEAVEVQGELARKSFDQWVNEGTKLSELTVKVTSEAMTPINSKISDAATKFVKPLAA